VIAAQAALSPPDKSGYHPQRCSTVATKAQAVFRQCIALSLKPAKNLHPADAPMRLHDRHEFFFFALSAEHP
jgi:hypothetical protein